MGKIEREISREPINDLTRFMKALSTAMVSLFHKLAKQRSEQATLDLARRMEERFFESAPPIAITVHGGPEITGKLKMWLQEQNFGFIPLENNVLLVSSIRAKEIMEMDRKLCVAKGYFLQEVSCAELENAIASLNLPNKHLLVMDNLSEDEATIFKNKCEIEKKPNTVGIDAVLNEAGEKTYKYMWRAEPSEVFSVPKRNENGFMQIDEFSSDVSKAWLETMFSLYAWDPKQKHNEIDYDRRLETDVADITQALKCVNFEDYQTCLPKDYKQYKTNPNGSRDFYIIGSTNRGDRKNYIHLTTAGFSVYEVKEAEGSPRTVTEVQHVSIDSPNFDGELRAQMDAIYNETILTDQKELDLFLDPQTNGAFLDIISGNGANIDTASLRELLPPSDMDYLVSLKEKSYAIRPMRPFIPQIESAKDKIPQYLDLAIKNQVMMEAASRGIDIANPENLADVMNLYQQEAYELMQNPILYRENVINAETAMALDKAFELIETDVPNPRNTVERVNLREMFEGNREKLVDAMKKNMHIEMAVARDTVTKGKDNPEYDKRSFFARDAVNAERQR